MQRSNTCFTTNISEDLAYNVLLSVPHCGIKFPNSFLEQSNLSRDSLLSTADLGTELLADAVPSLSAIKAIYGRSFVDLNRARTQLDAGVIDGIPRSNDPQIISGYGVIPRYAQNGMLTLSAKISYLEAEARLRAFYDPYHEKLSNLIEDHLMKFDQIILIDVHSAPNNLLGNIDIQIGTLFGNSCKDITRHKLATSLSENGLNVGFETPFSGGHITQAYCKIKNVETIQIEVNRRLLINENNQISRININKFIKNWKNSIHSFLKI